MVYEFFDEQFPGTSTSGGAVKNETMSNQHPSENMMPFTIGLVPYK